MWLQTYRFVAWGRGEERHFGTDWGKAEGITGWVFNSTNSEALMRPAYPKMATESASKIQPKSKKGEFDVGRLRNWKLQKREALICH